MKKVLWLYADRMGVGAYRVYIPALSLEGTVARSDFLLHAEIPPDDVTALDGKDVLVVQRAVGSLFEHWVSAAKERGIRTLYEMDDDLFAIPRKNPAHDYWMSRGVQRSLRRLLDMVDGVITSTKPLAQAVEDVMGWRPGERTFLCPNHLHPDVWGPGVWGQTPVYPNVTPRGEPYVAVGWQGSATHESDFLETLPALMRLITDVPNVMIRFFGCVPSSVKGSIPADRFQFTKGVAFERYPTTLRHVNFDIGIAPITNCRFNRAKSHLKWAEYSALGIPCVASAVYPYAKAIEHGRTGFLARTYEDWYRALRALVEDPSLRQAVGAAARETVWRDHGPEQARHWRTALRMES